jgi:hypothetical protein
VPILKFTISNVRTVAIDTRNQLWIEHQRVAGFENSGNISNRYLKKLILLLFWRTICLKNCYLSNLSLPIDELIING